MTERFTETGDMADSVAEFTDIYRSRPIVDNMGS